MDDQNQAKSTNRSRRKNRPSRRKAAILAEQSDLTPAHLPEQPTKPMGAEVVEDSQAVLQGLLRGSKGTFGSGSIENQAARLSNPHLQTAQRQALATQMGRVQGNRHLQRVITSLKSDRKPVAGQERPINQTVQRQLDQTGKSQESSLAQIARLANEAVDDPNTWSAFAGSPVRKNAPDGLGSILSMSGKTTLGVPGGLTQIKNAAAFTPPSFTTQTISTRTGHQVEHFAEVQPTTSADVTHDSFYPGPGDHERPGATQKIGGRTYQHYWRISRQVSALIQQGEQEHLDDALRAYTITYKLIADQINALAGQRFGPARTPSEADGLAEAALATRLPKQIGTNPTNWVRVLDALLSASRDRDTHGWHAVSIDPPQTSGNKIIHPVTTTDTTNVGQVPSSQVVNYSR